MDFALASSAHGRRKPCATIFAAALALGGAAPEEAVMVGDNLDDDIEGALAAASARCSSIAATAIRITRASASAGSQSCPPLLGLDRAAWAARVRVASAAARSAASSPSRSSRVVAAFMSAQRSQVVAAQPRLHDVVAARSR